MTVRCSQGHENPDGSAFCDECGEPLVAAPAGAAAGPTVGVPPAGPTGGPGGGPSAAPAAGATIICPQCGAPNAATDMFCSACGMNLAAAQPSTVPQAQQAVPQAPYQQPASAPQAPYQQQPAMPQASYQPAPAQQVPYPQPAAAPQAPYQQPAAQTPYQQPAAQTPYQPVPATVAGRLVVDNDNYSFDLPDKNEVLVGREDPVSNAFPDLDLTPHGGEEGGVSRMHAKIIRSGSQFFIEDQNSTNFTFLNRQRLQPKTATPLKDGDEIKLGRVVLHFHTP
jgi:hypothetical protein